MKKQFLMCCLLGIMALFLFSCGEENVEEIKNNEITISKKSSISAAHTVSPGGKVVYTVTVSNGGSSDMKIEISDTVPNGCRYVSGGFDVDGSRLSCDLLLKSGEIKDIEYIVEVSEDIDDIKNGKITSTKATLLSKSAVCNDIYVGYTFTDLDKERISTAIAALSYSENIDPMVLARQIYNVAFSKNISALVTAGDIMNEMFKENPTEDGLKYISFMAPTLYGGKKIGEINRDAFKGDSCNINKEDLIIGDLLFVKAENNTDLYIFDGDNLIFLNEGYDVKITEKVLTSLSDADLYAVLRPSMSIGESFGYDAFDNFDDLTLEQKALVETAKAYLLRGYRLQYDDSRMSSTYETTLDRGEFRWQIGLYEPEDYTSQKWGYVNCAGFTYEVYRTALGMDLGDLYSTAALASYYSSGVEGAPMYPYDCVPKFFTDEALRTAEIERFRATLKVGDLIVTRKSGNGHVMMYIGNDTVIHSTGASFNYSGDSETYEPTIRYMNVFGYLFDPEAKSCIFRQDSEINRLCIVRPLDLYEGKIPENTLNRIENLKDIVSEKLSSHCEGVTVNKGETITYSFVIKNIGKEKRTLMVTDRIPEGTTFISSDNYFLDGNMLNWLIEVAPDETSIVSYTVRVEAENGAYIYGSDGKVGGVSHRCPGVYVKNTLEQASRKAIVSAVEKYRKSNPDSLTGIELLNAIYMAAGLDRPFAESEEFVRESLFNSKNDSTGKSLIWTLDTESPYYNMIVPTFYGGRRFFTPQMYTETEKQNTDRARLPREQGLIVGDILITKFLSSEKIYLYIGDGVLVDLDKADLAEDVYSAPIRLMRMPSAGNYYIVLRPSAEM